MLLHIQGHRGARGNCPENTFSSFEFAIDSLVDSIETDLHLCADGEIVLIHDSGFHLPNSKVMYGVNEFNLKPIQRFFDSVPLINERFPDQKFFVGQLSQVFCKQHQLSFWAPPTLDQFCNFVDAYAGVMGKETGKTMAQQNAAKKLVLDLEIKQLPYLKCNSEFILKSIKHLISKRDWHDKIVLRSFDHTILNQAKSIQIDCALGFLTDSTIQNDFIKELVKSGASFFCPKYDCINQSLVNKMNDQGFKVLPWTANSFIEWHLLRSMGVFGITTDYPLAMQRWQTSQT